MSMEDWGAVKAQLIDTARVLAGKPGLAIQAVVQRLDELETRVECVHCGFVWGKGDEPKGHECSGNPLVIERDSLRCEVTALRQRVAELERDYAEVQDISVQEKLRAEAAEAKLAQEIEAANQRAVAQGEVHAALLDKLARCVEALEPFIRRHCGLCVPVDEQGRMGEVTTESCVCDADQKQARAALAAAKGE